MNDHANDPGRPVPPHPPYDELRSALGAHPEGHAALDDLHATLNADAPRADDVRTSADRLRQIPALEARVANWWDSPAVQQWMKIISDAGL